MALVGYARVSSVGQSLDVQLNKLKHCDKIYQEIKSGLLQQGQQLSAIPVNEILKLRQMFTRRGLQTFSEMPDSRYYPTLQRFLFFNRRSGLGFTVSGNS